MFRIDQLIIQIPEMTHERHNFLIGDVFVDYSDILKSLKRRRIVV